jgi:hypothetical protein
MTTTISIPAPEVTKERATRYLFPAIAMPFFEAFQFGDQFLTLLR